MERKCGNSTRVEDEETWDRYSKRTASKDSMKHTSQNLAHQQVGLDLIKSHQRRFGI